MWKYNESETFPDYIFTIIYFINNFKQLLLLLLGDIDVNPKRSSNFKFCYWSLNGLVDHDFTHDFIEVLLVEVFLTSNNFDIICLSETF